VKEQKESNTNKTFCELIECPDAMESKVKEKERIDHAAWTLKDNMCVHKVAPEEEWPCYYLTKKGTFRKRILPVYEELVNRDEYEKDGIVLVSAYLKWRNEQENKRKTISNSRSV